MWFQTELPNTRVYTLAYRFVIFGSNHALIYVAPSALYNATVLSRTLRPVSLLFVLGSNNGNCQSILRKFDLFFEFSMFFHFFFPLRLFIFYKSTIFQLQFSIIYFSSLPKSPSTSKSYFSPIFLTPILLETTLGREREKKK